ncbi:hypothetical protein B0T18DRAFT_386231 [Schizothecium vesticola]|uniref:Uncharacterized protein n=1 Tax=Schizothecium vesticola TaxID=314040 RepID=A0AA40FAP2_9PEZI|nr:hypothetical protein B0T18DRAFT_386231 [Schizothecium vesticola]
MPSLTSNLVVPSGHCGHLWEPPDVPLPEHRQRRHRDRTLAPVTHPVRPLHGCRNALLREGGTKLTGATCTRSLVAFTNGLFQGRGKTLTGDDPVQHVDDLTNRFDERPPTRRKGEFDQGWLSPRLEQLRERHVPSRQDIFGIDHAPPPPSRLHDRPIYKPREVVVYDDDPVSPPPKPLLARHGREHNSLPERPPQPPRAPPPPRPPQAPQPPQASPPPPPPPPPPVPPATNLDPTVLKLLTTLHSALSHTHYAITGPLALTAWGFPPSPTHSDTITILCPADDRAVIRAWAAAAGFGIGTSPSHRHHNPDEMTVDISLPRHHHNDRDRPTTRFTVVLHPLPPAKWAIAARESAVLRGGVQIAGLLGT